MADNVTLPGTGDVVAADDAGAGGKVQIIKLAISTDGSATVIPADATNGLDVDVTRVQGTVTVGDGGSSLSVDDNGGSLTVDGTVNAALNAGTNAIGKVGHDSSGLGDGRTTVTTAGTRVALASSTTAKWVTITAETDNTGVIVVGSSTCVAALATRRGTPLNPGDSVTLLVDNLNDVNLDSTVSGDGVTYTYGT